MNYDFDELDDLRERFLAILSRFRIKKPGGNPLEWDPGVLDGQYDGASHGEKCSIQFLLNLWDPKGKWKCGKFDFFEAWTVWDDRQREAFLQWAVDPFWP